MEICDKMIIESNENEDESLRVDRDWIVSKFLKLLEEGYLDDCVESMRSLCDERIVKIGGLVKGERVGFDNIKIDRRYSCPMADGNALSLRGIDLVREICAYADRSGGKFPGFGIGKAAIAFGWFEHDVDVRHPEDDFVMTEEWFAHLYAKHGNDDFRKRYVDYYTMYNAIAERNGWSTVDAEAMADADMSRSLYIKADFN